LFGYHVLRDACVFSWDSDRRSASKGEREDGRTNDSFTSTPAVPFAQTPARGPDIGFTVSGMDHKMTALERAFQLASSGQVSKIAEIYGVVPFFAA